MNKVKIIADSTIDLTQEMYEKNQIQIVPLQVRFGEETYNDGVDITQEQLYKKVKEKKELPSTAAISPDKFIDIAKNYIDDGYDIIFIGVGSKLSSTFQNMRIASMEFPEGRVFCIDSDSLSSGSGLLALKCCKLRDEGKSAKEIYDIVQPMAKLVSAKFVLDQFDYMHKGGRCSAMVALFGHLFHIHPILKMIEGKLQVESKPRGPIKVAYKEMLKELENDLPNVDLDNVLITHAGCNQDDLNYLKEEVSKLVDPNIVHITPAGCVISSHCGYGTVGILYIKK